MKTTNAAVGLASDFHATRSNDTAITGIWSLNNGQFVQGYFMVESNGTTTFSAVGAAYKYTISGDEAEGLHVGGGLGIGGSDGNNFTHINGIVGFHFGVARQISIHIDGGISVGSANSKSETYFNGNSPLFGLSAVYNI